MSSFVEGGFTVKIDKVSAVVAQDKANTVLEKAKSYDRMYYATYGPFTVGEYICEIRVSPRQGYLYLFLCFLEKNAGVLKKGGYVVQAQNFNLSIKGKLDVDLNFDSYPYIKQSGLPTLFLFGIGASSIQSNKDDCLIAKILAWLVLDDSKVGPAKKPNQPSNSPPDFISTLLAGKLADVQFTVREQTFSAHRAIFAARSSVFESALLALNDKMCWNKLHISVQHMDAVTFKYLLHFVYTNSLPSDFENTPEKYRRLFIAAHRFKIEGLKLICEEKLTKVVAELIVATLEDNECDQELSLLKIVPKDFCHTKPEIITATTMRKALLGDRVYGTSD